MIIVRKYNETFYFNPKKAAIILVIFLSGAVACTSAKKYSSENISSQQSIRLPDSLIHLQKQGIDFIATGNDPMEWKLNMDFDKSIDFTSPEENLSVPAVKGERLSNSSIVSYKSVSASGQLNLFLYEQPCANTGGMNNKRVEITVNNKRYVGCGKYLYDNRINEHWILERINNSLQEPAAYSKGLPYIKLDIKANKFSGSDGCNSINGAIEIKGSRIDFSSIVSTKMGCENNRVEKIFSELISNRLVDYYIKNEKLVLYLIDDSTLTFTRSK